MSNRYETATPEELDLYRYAANTRRELVRTLDMGIGMTGNVVALSQAMRTLRDALTLDEVMLKNAIAQKEQDEL